MKAIFFDIDGTLLECAQGKLEMSAHTKRVLRMVQKQGVRLFVASGRPYSFLPKEIKAFGFDGYVLANGAYLEYRGQEVGKHFLPGELVGSIVARLEQAGIQHALQLCNKTYLDREYKDLLAYFRGVLFNEECMVCDGKPQCIRETLKLELFIAPKQAETCFSIISALESMYNPESGAVEAYSRQVSKGSGIREMLEALELDAKESMCFGDARNDLEMFDAVGMAVAMGNASEDVKRRADRVCRTVMEDGAARFLEEMQWISNIE